MFIALLISHLRQASELGNDNPSFQNDFSNLSPIPLIDQINL